MRACLREARRQAAFRINGGDPVSSRPSSTAARLLFLTVLLCCNLGDERYADVHALLVLAPCFSQQRLEALHSTASSFSNRPRDGNSAAADAAAAALMRPWRRRAPLVGMLTGGNWGEYFGGGGGGSESRRSVESDGVGGGERDRAARTGGRDSRQGRASSTGTARSGGGGGGRESNWGDDWRGGGGDRGYNDRGRGRGGARGGGGGRTSFNRGRSSGRVEGGAARYGNGGGRRNAGGQGRGGPAKGRAHGRGRPAGRSGGPGYNMDDFVLVEEGTGDDGTWDDFGDFTDDAGQYTKPRGADTAYVEDLGSELKVQVVPRRVEGSLSAAPPTRAVFSTDPNLSPVSGESGLGRSHNRERREAQREQGRRQRRDSEKGRGEGGRLWSEDDGARDSAAAAVEAARVRDGAQLRIKRREARETAERERRAAYFASLDEQGGEGAGEAGEGLGDLFADYFSPQKASAPAPSSAAAVAPPPPPPPQRFSRQVSLPTASSWDRFTPAVPSRGIGGRGGAAAGGGSFDNDRRSPTERTASERSGSIGYAAGGDYGGGGGGTDGGHNAGDYGAGVFGDGGGGGRREPAGGRGDRPTYGDFSEPKGRVARQGRGGAAGGGRGEGRGRRDGFDQNGRGQEGRASFGGADGGRGRVLDNSVWDADRWEATGSTAWLNTGDGDSGGGVGRGGKGSLPNWKVPRKERETVKAKRAAPTVPSWMPPTGGLGSEARRGIAPLPDGIDTSVKKLGVKGLEARLKAKFSKMKEGVFAGEDDDVDFYDPDDEGFERPQDGGDSLLPLVESESDVPEITGGAEVDVAAAVEEFRAGAVRYPDPGAPRPKGSGVVARAEAEAAGGGFRMRSPSRAAATASYGIGDDGPVSPLGDETLPTSKKQKTKESEMRDIVAAGLEAGGGGAVRSSMETAGAPGWEKDRRGAEAGAGATALVEEQVQDGSGGKKRKETKKAKLEPETTKSTYTSISIADMETLEPQASVSFRDLRIEGEGLLANIEGLGITSPTATQVSAIRGLLSEDRDVIIHAHTGSGKTLAYLLPLIAATDPNSNAVQAIVVAPGRELAAQIFSVCERLIKGSGLRSAMIIGGANALRQVERVKKVKPQIIVATPGRLCELVFDRRRMKLGMVHTVVLDEVDALLRPPYDQEIDAIMDATPADRRQVVFASATGRSPLVSAASKRYMRESPLFVGGDEAAGGLQRRGGLPSNIRHTIVTMPKVKKFDTLRRLLNTQPFPESVMIFVNDPTQVNWLTERLETVGIIAAPLSGESSKDDRAEIMRRLQDKRIAMVVTTEMAARGLDVAHLTHVVNYDLPTDADHYVHRAGRCGRAGRPGIVVNMATPEVKFVLGKFSRSLGIDFDNGEIQGGRFWAVSRPETPAAAAKAGASAMATATVTAAVAAPVAAVPAAAGLAAGEIEAAGGGIPDESSDPDVAAARRSSSSVVDRGFLGDPIVSSRDEESARAEGMQGATEDGGRGGLLSTLDADDADDVDDISAEAKASFEGEGTAGTASSGMEEVVAAGEALPSSSRGLAAAVAAEDIADDAGGWVYVHAADEAKAAAFLKGDRRRDTGGAAAAAVAAVGAAAAEAEAEADVAVAEAASLPSPSSRRGKKPRADMDIDGETYEVAGGLAVVLQRSEAAEDGVSEEEEDWEGGWDEDDWGDGDWGDGEQEEEEEEGADGA